MDITTLGNWLWEAACTIRGPLDVPKFKDYILKRLCDGGEGFNHVGLFHFQLKLK